MTYAAYESSQQSGRPVELYVFTLGLEINRYTNAEDQITFQSQVYYPKQIKRTSPSQSNEQRRQQMEITLPADDVVASRFIGIVPGQLMTLSVVRTHRDDPDEEGLVLWEGRITGASFKDNGVVCTLQGLTTEAALARTMPRFKFQGMCNHVLGDTRCQITLDPTYKFTGTVSTLSGSTVTIPGLLAAKGDGWATGGYIEFGADDWRLVLDQTGNDCRMLLNFESNVVGQSVDVYAGCDHSLATCGTKFSNVINFGGFPYVPKRNPFSAGID